MRKLLLFTLLCAALPAWSQTTQNGRVQTGAVASKPATCAAGDQYNATDTSQILICGPAPNAWVVQTSGTGATLSSDNTFTNNNRFGGPIPWRDVTKYMPAGGCSSATANADPQTTGTISSSSATLTLAAARDFKNGCGIAVVGAGPTSTMAAPNQGCTISAISRASNVVTLTCVAGHNIPVTSTNKPGQGVQITGVTDSSYNGTFETVSVADTTHITYAQTGANSSSSGGTMTMQFGYAHGIAGSTTYNYKVSAVDVSGGMGPASAAITITTGNATLNTSNFNWINWGASFTPYLNSTVPHEWVIYSDKGLGGAYSCVGTSFTNGYSDFGMAMPCPVFAPVTPPVSATAQVLNAIISSGGGTTTLTLAPTASNNATTQNVYHDESSFLNSCLTDDATDRNPAGFSGQAGTFGCYIPAGNYYMNGPMYTDTTTSTIGGSIWVAGSLWFNIFPWYFSHNSFFVKGYGGSGLTGQFSHANATELQFSSSIAGAIVIHGGANIGFSGFSIPNLQGHGIWIGEVPYINAPSTYLLNDDIITELGGGAGAPLLIDNNTIGIWSDNLSLTPSNSAVGLPSIYVTMSSYDANVSCCAYFRNLTTIYKGLKFDGPGGNGSGGGPNSFKFDNWINESLIGTEKGLIVHDNGPNAPGAVSSVVPLNGVGINTLNNSDPAGGPSGYALFTELGTAMQISATVNGASAFGPLLNCANASTACNDHPALAGTFSSAPSGGTLGGSVQISNQLGGTFDVEDPIISQLAYNQYSAGLPAFGQAMPPPETFAITGTGAGSLAAATYCMAVEGKDNFASPGFTMPTATLCQTVGASASISLQWLQITNQLYGGFRFFWCTGAACTPNTYLDIAGGNGTISYTFTSTAGGTGGSLATSPTAFLTFIGWGGKSCILCVLPAGNIGYPLGVGDPAPPATSKLSILGELNVTSGIYRTTTPQADQSCGAGTYFIQATTATNDYKKCVNGTLLPVTGTIASGTATMTTGAITGPACGTTVTVSATGVASTDVISWAYNAAPAANPGELVVSAWPTSNNVNFQYCLLSGTVTPTAATLNWKVIR